MASGDDEGCLVARGTVRKLKRLNDRLGGGGVAPPPAPPSGWGAGWNPGIQRAIVSTAIPTGTNASPTNTGRIKLRIKDAAGAWQDGPAEVVWNDFTMSASIPTNRMVRVAWIAGEWWLVSASCS